jgi:hypothetical protein
MASQDDHLLVFSDCVVCAFGNRKWKSGKVRISLNVGHVSSKGNVS